MRIEINDDIAQQCNLDEKEALELLAIAVYKAKGLTGSVAGKILGMNEFDFHSFLISRNETVNYESDNSLNARKNNNLFGR
ncbi:hypothetical protein BTA51_01965 [Hahella sp. CCB-MM4]|uniref:UPF0175 family protein n=1 Tax=Hahella sp. (strain CCB-MM4) TaxID=1926491 RepID=UPI000B9C7035|nr:UPF0175 family protein [Hahella sp. CCB-MM4]OZG75174.1 hypothetical protein BTA51_01965 [Hahella sp. CCB-MM4]